MRSKWLFMLFSFLLGSCAPASIVKEPYEKITVHYETVLFTEKGKQVICATFEPPPAKPLPTKPYFTEAMANDDPVHVQNMLIDHIVALRQFIDEDRAAFKKALEDYRLKRSQCIP